MFVIVAVSRRLSVGSLSDRRFPFTFCGQRFRSHFVLVLLVLFCPVVVLPCSLLFCLCASQVVCDLTCGWNLRSFLSLLSFLPSSALGLRCCVWTSLVVAVGGYSLVAVLSAFLLWLL